MMLLNIGIYYNIEGKYKKYKWYSPLDFIPNIGIRLLSDNMYSGGIACMVLTQTLANTRVWRYLNKKNILS